MVAWSSYLVRLLANAKPGTAKNKVYQMNFGDGQLKKSVGVAVKVIMSKPKTLFYSQRVSMIHTSPLLAGKVVNWSDDPSDPTGPTCQIHDPGPIQC